MKAHPFDSMAPLGRPWRRCMLALAAFALVGCAGAPRVEVARDPQADFSEYETFAFQRPLGTDREDGTVTVLSQNLKRSARRELESLGYRYVEEGADLRVNFFVATREVVEGMSRPGVGIRYGTFHSRYGVWLGYETDVRQYTEGSLHVDVVDAERNQLVWEGVAQRRLREGDFTYRPEDVEEAIRRVFARFPRHVPGGGGPAD